MPSAPRLFVTSLTALAVALPLKPVADAGFGLPGFAARTVAAEPGGGRGGGGGNGPGGGSGRGEGRGGGEGGGKGSGGEGAGGRGGDDGAKGGGGGKGKGGGQGKGGQGKGGAGNANAGSDRGASGQGNEGTKGRGGNPGQGVNTSQGGNGPAGDGEGNSGHGGQAASWTSDDVAPVDRAPVKPRIARKRQAPPVVPAAIPPRRPDTPRRPADALDEARAPDAARAPPRPSPNGAEDRAPSRSARTLVASGLSAAEIGTLERLGFRQVRRTAGRSLPAVVTLSVPQAVDIDTARETARRVTTAAVDFDHFYYTDGHGTDDCVGADCPPVPAPLWVSARTAHCGITPTIGLVDTAIARDHPALLGQSIVVLGPDGRPGDAAPMRSVRGDAAVPADGEGGSTHGTAIATLLVGRADGRVPGLLPEATLVAVNAFSPDAQGRERTDVATLVDAIEHLAARGVRVVNLSLSGPPNAVLEAAVAAAARDGIVLVAAAGNGGPYAEPAFPAAYPNVIAVTAVDRTLDVYRRATRGTYVDFAAPGVEVWTAAAGPMSGTSYAVPFVTAAVAAHLAARPGATPAAVAGHLAASAFDLGTAGRDHTYGWGLVRADSCPGTQPPSVEQAGADLADPTRPDQAAPTRRAPLADRFGPAAVPFGADAPDRAGDSIQAVR